MSTRNKLAITALLTAALLASAQLFAGTITPQIGGGLQFDGGIASQGVAAPPPSTCPGTGLDFSDACNSQYIGTL